MGASEVLGAILGSPSGEAEHPCAVEGCASRVWLPGMLCPRCHDERRRTDEEERRRKEFEDRKRRAVETIPRSYLWASFDAPELSARVRRPECIEQARSAVDAPLVLLTGNAGTGKTSLAVAMMRHIVDGGETGARFVGAYWLAKARLEHRLGEGEAPLVATAMRAPVLVLDDVGIELDKTTAVHEVIYERHAREQRTIVTTGFGYRQLADRYGDGIARRLSERAVVIKCGGAK